MGVFRRLLPLLFVCFTFAMPVTGRAAVDVMVSVTVAPPPLPVYAQPVIPASGYIWMPGYWAWGPQGYYWVPGTWVLPPARGLLWTPGYWGWNGAAFIWHAGYWGPRVGFYGGVDYGFGYTGDGYHGGYWRRDVFYYNTAVTNFRGVRITHVYRQTIVNNIYVRRVSYNGGRGGIAARPTAEDEAAARERHFAPTGLQLRHQYEAADHHAFLNSVNHGRPAIAATPRATVFSGHGVVRAEEPHRPAARRPDYAAPHRGPVEQSAHGAEHGPQRGPQRGPERRPESGPQHGPQAQRGAPHGRPEDHRQGPEGGPQDDHH